MKRIALWLLIASASLLSASAQQSERAKPLTPAQQRKLERQQTDAAYALKIQDALANESFYFRGRDMQLRSLDRVDLRAPYDYVEVQPGLLTVRLPYFTSEHTMGRTWPILDFESRNFTYTVDENKGVYTVVINVKEVTNRSTIGSVTQSSSYQLLFNLSSSQGTVRLTITPNFTGPVGYSGDLVLD